MNKDADYQSLRQGDYPHGKNIRPVNNEGGSLWDNEAIIGNLYVADLGLVDTQDKTYLAYINTLDATAEWEFTIYDPNGSVVAQVSLVVGAQNFAAYIAALKLLLDAAMPTDWSYLLVENPITADTGLFHITVSMAPYDGVDYTFTVQNITPTPATNADVFIYAEAIDLSMAGVIRAIGSWDLLGDLFVWATPCTKLPASFTVFSTADAAGLIQVRTTEPHGMTADNDGEVISISGTGTSADGIWFATFVDDDELILEGSVWGGVSAIDGTLTKNVNYYGVIASVIYDINTDVWTLTKLIRSRELPFTTKKQIQGEVHKSNVEDAILHSFYWTDRNDIPRAFYYQGTFINDGAINILNPETNLGDDGLYEYGLINDETKLLLNSNRARLTYTGMVQTGGAVKAGNNRYSFFLETENGGKTALQLLTNPVNVYSSEESVSDNKFIIGDRPGATTPKRVQLQITGLDVGLFKYINLVNVLQVAPGSYVITNVSRTEITEETMQLEHSGLEQNSFPMASSELLVETRDIKSAWHLVTLDSILILGNITENDELDFLPVTTNMWHTLHRWVMPMCGFVTNLGPACEYQVVDHVHNRAGYPYGETARFGLRPTYKINGAQGKVSWIDDIRFDNSITNISNSANGPYGNRRGWKIKEITYIINLPAPGDTTLFIVTEGETGFIVGNNITVANVTGLAPLVSINTTHTITTVNSPTQFNVVLAGVLVTGNYTDYSGHITNALPSAALTNDPVANPEVNGEVYTFYPQFHNINWDYVLENGKKVRDVVDYFEIVRCEIIDEILLTGIVFSSDPHGTGTWYPQTEWVGSPSAANVGNQTNPLNDPDRRLGFFVSADTLLNYRRVAYSSGDQIIIYGTSQARYIQLTTLPTVGANKDKYFEWNGSFSESAAPLTVNLEAATNVSKGGSGTIVATTIGSVPFSLTEIAGHEWDLNMVLAAGPGAGDYFQDSVLDPGVMNCAYFHALTDKYGAISEGKYIPTGHYFKPAITQGSRISNQSVFGGNVFTQKTYLHIIYKPTVLDYGGTAISFYSQNKANTQNRYHDPADLGQLFPSHATSIDTWVAGIASGPRDQFFYNKSYSIYNELNQLLAYDPSLQVVTQHPALLVWTPLKVLGGLVDAWRIILPLAFKYLDLSKGEITGVWVLNGELYVMQQRAFTRHFFNSRGILQTTESEEIILGSGDVLARNGITLTTIGCLEKWNQLKGMSESGDDTLYWVNTEHYKFCRFAADGTRVISDIQGMESWFANYLPWVRRKDNPADDEGTCAVWNGRFHEAIFTFRGRKRTDVYRTSGANYEVGDEVHLLEQPAGTYANFSQTGEIYVCTANHTPSVDFAPETGVDWETVWRKVLHTEKEYFSEFTLVYSEKEKKAFISFTSFLPNIYLQVGNGYQTPRPAPQDGEGELFAQNKLYWHNHGQICEWYKTGAYGSVAAMNYTSGSATITTASGFLAMFPHPEVYTYTIPILGIDYYVLSVESDTSLTLQTIYDEDGVAILPNAAGNVGSYYVSLAEDAELDMVVNEEPNLSKVWEYLQLNTSVIPYRIDFETNQHRSFLTQLEFEFLENYWYGQVKSDSTATPTVNDNDTSDLFGSWLKVGFKMRRFVYQKIRNFITVCRENLPNPLR